MSKIKSIKAREILDSRGDPTIEVDLVTQDGIFQSSVPSGASKGRNEAKELRDGGKRYHGKGVLKAIKNVNEVLAEKLEGKEATQQKEIDYLMLKLDGTKNKARLGANAILAVSMAVCRAGAKAKGISLFQYISQIFNFEYKNQVLPESVLPQPCFNIINGGAHAGSELDVQEFMILPRAGSFVENLRQASEIYHVLKGILKEKFKESSINLGDEGGFSPPLNKSEEALSLIMEAIKKSGYFQKTEIGLDVAATQFYKNKKYNFEGRSLTSKEFLNFYKKEIQDFPILFIEDPFAEEDFDGFAGITRSIEKKIFILGDDLITTNLERMKIAEEKKACSGMIIKPNQVGTVTETLEAAKLAKFYGWKILVSHRSGDTFDSFISDLAVGIGADFIKAGAPARGERVEKYNRLLRIEEELKK
ncbi:MAG: phosphopyruvate hydratase [Candidatus Nealsonbacteria bacterium]|nr:phosphopyruvate hydratase [Candidatus Nealsonbacteria bacterium]